ncbi:hypothetical protein BDZ45DRAFT_779767 [Acephala macrosclerotiorum]|nr:hypothetical protein BDZ45DRAFT_779767 [Acephala macrosclerotiorum]
MFHLPAALSLAVLTTVVKATSIPDDNKCLSLYVTIWGNGEPPSETYVHSSQTYFLATPPWPTLGPMSPNPGGGTKIELPSPSHPQVWDPNTVALPPGNPTLPPIFPPLSINSAASGPPRTPYMAIASPIHYRNSTRMAPTVPPQIATSQAYNPPFPSSFVSGNPIVTTANVVNVYSTASTPMAPVIDPTSTPAQVAIFSAQWPTLPPPSPSMVLSTLVVVVTQSPSQVPNPTADATSQAVAVLSITTSVISSMFAIPPPLTPLLATSPAQSLVSSLHNLVFSSPPVDPADTLPSTSEATIPPGGTNLAPVLLSSSWTTSLVQPPLFVSPPPSSSPPLPSTNLPLFALSGASPLLSTSPLILPTSNVVTPSPSSRPSPPPAIPTYAFPGCGSIVGSAPTAYQEIYFGAGFTENPINPGNPSSQPPISLSSGSITMQFSEAYACYILEECFLSASSYHSLSVDLHLFQTSDTMGYWVCSGYPNTVGSGSYFNVQNASVLVAYGYDFISPVASSVRPLVPLSMAPAGLSLSSTSSMLLPHAATTPMAIFSRTQSTTSPNSDRISTADEPPLVQLATSSTPNIALPSSQMANMPTLLFSSATSQTSPVSTQIPTINGICGGDVTCIGWPLGECCSKYGFCGNDAGYCESAAGCQPQFGICWVPSAAVSSPAYMPSSLIAFGPSSIPIPVAAPLSSTNTEAIIPSSIHIPPSSTLEPIVLASSSVQTPQLSSTSAPLAIIQSSTNTAALPIYTSGDITPTDNGVCGNGVSCLGWPVSECCSLYGYCGSAAGYCGTGCQPAFGVCGLPSSSMPALAPGSTITSPATSSAPSGCAVAPASPAQYDCGDNYAEKGAYPFTWTELFFGSCVTENTNNPGYDSSFTPITKEFDSGPIATELGASCSTLNACMDWAIPQAYDNVDFHLVKDGPGTAHWECVAYYDNAGGNYFNVPNPNIILAYGYDVQ